MNNLIVKEEDFKVFVGLKVHVDTIKNAEKIYGKPSRVLDADYGRKSYCYDVVGQLQLLLGVDFSQKIVSIAVKNTNMQDEFFTSCGVHDKKIQFLGQDEDNIISCLGEPFSDDDGLSYWPAVSRSDLNVKVVSFIFDDFSLPGCSCILVV